MTDDVSVLKRLKRLGSEATDSKRKLLAMQSPHGNANQPTRGSLPAGRRDRE